jgi:hypothetical protein
MDAAERHQEAASIITRRPRITKPASMRREKIMPLSPVKTGKPLRSMGKKDTRTLTNRFAV